MRYIIIIVLICFSFANSFTGKVVDEFGNPIIGANIELVGTDIGSSTDLDGFFIIDMNLNYSFLKISHIQYSSKIIDLSLNKDNQFILYESSLDVNPVVVTGLRQNSYIKDTPTKTQIINTNDIKKSGVYSVKDLLEITIPNVQNVMSSHAGVSNNNIKIQGLDNSYMLFLIDGARVSGEFAGNLDFNMLDLSNVDRIEVIEGGMSSLYGSNAIAGVVNIITKKPIKPFEFDFGYFYDEPMIISKYINLGFNLNKISYSLNLSNQQSDGYDLTPQPQTVSYPLKTLEEYSAYTLNHSFKFKLGNYLSFLLNHKNYKNKIYQYQNHFVNNIIDESNELYPNYYYSSLRNDNPLFEDYEYKFDISYNKNNSSLNLRSHIDSYKKSNYFYNYTELDCDNPDENYFCQNQENLFQAEFINAENYNKNFFVKYDFSWSDNNYFTIGYESVKNDYSSFNIYQNSTGDLNNDGECGEGFPWDPSDCLVESIFGGIDGLKSYKKESVFIGSQIDFQNKNIFSMSLRNVSSKNYGDDIVYSAAYMIKSDLNNYRFNFSKGFRLPSIKELYYDFQSHPPPILGNPNLKSATNNYFSISIEQRSSDVNSSLEIYYNDVDNMIGTNYVDSDDDGQDDIIMYNNFSHVNISGINFHYEMYNDRDGFKAVYNFTNPKSNDKNALELISRHSFRVRYTREIVKDKLDFIMNTKYSGKKFIMNDSEKIYLDGYFLSDIIFSLSIDKSLSINIGCKNIFNYIDERRFLDDDYLKNILSSYDPGRRYFLDIKFSL